MIQTKTDLEDAEEIAAQIAGLRLDKERGTNL